MDINDSLPLVERIRTLMLVLALSVHSLADTQVYLILGPLIPLFSLLGFKARVGSALFALQRQM